MLNQNFLSTCQQLGTDISAIQGAGGNISIKDNDTMIIKASGTWLADALQKNIFTSASIKAVLQAVQENNENFSSLNNNSLRPSIETPLHALLPFTVVIHIHCVYAIVYSLSSDAKANLSTILEGFSWTLVPYARPGLPLAHAIQEAFRTSPKSDIFILQNHGLIVGGTDIDDAFDKLLKVRSVLKLEARPHLEPDLEFLDSINNMDWIIPDDMCLHSLATDEHSLKFASHGVLYPDHAVFLGTAFPVAQQSEKAQEAFARLCKEANKDINYIIYPKKGVLISPHNTQGQNELIHALAMVCGRIQPNQHIQNLSLSDLNDLINWDAEKYRQSLEGVKGKQ